MGDEVKTPAEEPAGVMGGLKAELLAAVEASDWSEEDKGLARTVVASYTGFVIRQVQGQAEEGELAVLDASLRNIGSATTSTVVQVFSEVAGGYLRKLAALLVK